ncbi:hypothetical protein [Sanyastnella coralliicola]|uniref:hypothetical protein n=1 Tax=Sanyastnella coralliicola TaxID=3069118 RepID=UPI0027B8A601|nr:hypothetical protein [Longitalea sp. SCSIO 12813]
MKNYLLIACLLLTTALNAQVETCIGNNGEMQTLFGGDRSFGGFIGLGTKFTTLNDQGGMMLGGEINGVFGHSLNVGFVGYGLVTDVYGVNRDDDNQRLYYEMGYGGLNIEPVFFSRRAIHFSAPVVIGAGGIGESRQRFIDIDEFDEDQDYDWPDFYNSDFFLVVEPGLQLEINLLRAVRLYGGASYRFVTDVDLPNTDVDRLGGISANFGLRFGWF